MSEKYVVRLKNAAIYHADNPFGSTSEAKLLQRGEMVLSDVNLCVAPGEFVYLLGRVGSGKSTLLKTLYAEVQLLTGEGRVAGFDLRRLKRRDIPYLRRRIGIVFQDYQLLTDRNVFMNLRAFGRRAAASGDRPRTAQRPAGAAGRRAYRQPRSRDGRGHHAAFRGDRLPRLRRGDVHAQHRPHREPSGPRHPLLAGQNPRGGPQGGAGLILGIWAIGLSGNISYICTIF